jgi:hypothetical protein
MLRMLNRGPVSEGMRGKIRVKLIVLLSFIFFFTYLPYNLLTL